MIRLDFEGGGYYDWDRPFFFGLGEGADIMIRIDFGGVYTILERY